MYMRSLTGQTRIINPDQRRSSLPRSVNRMRASNVTSLSLIGFLFSAVGPNDEILFKNVLDYQAVFSCFNLLDINLDGADVSLLIFRGIAENCPRIQSISVRAIADPDDGASLEVLAACHELRVLNVSSWFDLTDRSVVHLISECLSLCSMLVSHCKCITAEAVVPKPLGTPFKFMSDPRCTPWCLPPKRICATCVDYQMEDRGGN
mmetsp:Transcript_63007/g.123791  ORF Transcript_63007/g.123791 Transcript_63007/m.123791 type:complete len:206 (+) Transcript_63007:84-701(+)